MTAPATIVLVCGLGEDFDVGDFNGEYRLIPTKRRMTMIFEEIEN